MRRSGARWGIGAALAVAVAVTAMLPVGAASAVTVSGQWPVDGTVVPGSRPEVSMTFTADLAPGSVVLRIDGVVVTATVTPTYYYLWGNPYLNGYTLSWTPTADLATGSHTVQVDFEDTSGNPGSDGWSFDVQPGPPVVSTFAPARSSVATIYQYEEWVGEWSIVYKYGMAAYTADLYDPDGVSSSGYSMAVRMAGGTTQTVTPTFSYITTDQVRARLLWTMPRYDPQTPQLPREGRYGVSVTARDALGNSATNGWTFDARYDSPTYSARIPQGVVSVTTPTIAARVTDWYTGVDAATIVMRVDGVTVTPVVSAVTGDAKSRDVSYTPPAPLVDGTHTVQIDARDTAGLPGSTTWDFRTTSVNTGPVMSGVLPAAGTTVTASSFYAEVIVTDGDGIDSASHRLTVQTRTGSVELTPTLTWVSGTNQTQAKLRQLVNLPYDGARSLTFSIADSRGATSSVSWSINQVSDSPSFVSVTPPETGGYSGIPKASRPDTYLPTITVRMKDAGSGIDPDTIVVKRDGVEVTHTATPVDADNYDIAYTPDAPLVEDQTHLMQFTCADNAGNIGSKFFSVILVIPPKITGFYPASGSAVTSEQVWIGAVFESETRIVTGTIDFKVDYESVTPEVVVRDGGRTVEFRYSSLLPPGDHTVAVKVSDDHGHTSATSNWNFALTYPPSTVDMDSRGNEVCRTCHGGGTPASWNSLHNVQSWWEAGRGHPYTCSWCHDPGPLDGPGGCICHSFANAPELHGGTPGYSWSANSNPFYFRVTAPRGEFDCVYCHQQPIGIERTKSHFASSGRHDFPVDHLIDVDPGCVADECHATSLTREHARAGREDASGAMTCMSCHGSSDPNVTGAITSYPAKSLVTAGEVSGVYSVPGKSITGVTLRTRTQYSYLYLHAWRGSTWVTESVVNVLNPGASYVVTFAPAAQIRLTVKDFGLFAAGAMDEIQVTPADAPVTCVTCHPGATGHPHPSVDVTNTIANGERSCADCHSGDIVFEHGKATSSSSAAGCDACHAAGGAREQIGGAWDATCDTPACHGPASTRPMHSSYCLGCHDEATSGFTTAKVDFEVASVDRATACAKCHWEPAGAHPYHNSTWNCSSCHVSMGFVDPSAIPRVSTAYGWFATAGSADAGADELHAIHANPNWAGSLTKNGRQCGSCHAPAACTACHGDLSVDPGHAQHSWDESSTDYWPGTGPEDTVYGRGTTPGNEGERTVGPGLTCSNPTCHPAPVGTAAPYLVENRESRVVYSGGVWGRSGTNGYTANSYSISAATGARATLAFSGTKVALIADRHPYRGQARIILDGTPTATVDLYAPSTTKQVVIWDSPELAAGEHTVTVEVLGTKDAASKAPYVVVDAFRVTPSASRIRSQCSACHGPDIYTGSSVDRTEDH